VARAGAAVRPHGRAIALAILVLLAATAHAAGPYELEASRETALIAGGLGLGVSALVLQRASAPGNGERLAPATLWPLDRSATTRWSRTAADASDWGVAALVLSPVLLAATSGDDEDGTILLMHAESLALTGGVVAVLKNVVDRPRPLVYNPDPRISEQERQRSFAARSFPSGHAANAFASAMLLGEVYAGLHPDDEARHWVRYGSLAAAATVSYLRYAAGLHFPTDLLAGAAIGAAVGWAVPRLHEADDTSGPAGAGPGLTLRFAF